MAKKKEFQLAESLIPNVHKVQAEIIEPSVLEEMSLAEYNREKQLIDAKRKHLSLILDKRKLEQAQRIVDHMEMILDRIGEGYDRENVSPLDIKLLTDAYMNMQKALERVSRIDSLDSEGRAARLSIEVRFGEY